MPARHTDQLADGQLAELLELAAEEAEDFRSFVGLRGAEGTVEEVRDWVLAMIELYRGRAAALLTDRQLATPSPQASCLSVRLLS